MTFDGSGTITGLAAGGLPNSSVTADDIASSAVTTAKIADANITAAKLDGAQSGSAPIYAARAWVNFNGTGTVAIRASGNVSSITDNGTGDYTANFTTAMADANYTVVSTAQRGDSVAGGIIGQVQGTTANAYTSITTTSVRIRTINVAEATIDPLYVGVSIFR